MVPYKQVRDNLTYDSESSRARSSTIPQIHHAIAISGHIALLLKNKGHLSTNLCYTNTTCSLHKSQWTLVKKRSNIHKSASKIIIEENEQWLQHITTLPSSRRSLWKKQRVDKHISAPRIHQYFNPIVIHKNDAFQEQKHSKLMNNLVTADNFQGDLPSTSYGA